MKPATFFLLLAIIVLGGVAAAYFLFVPASVSTAQGPAAEPATPAAPAAAIAPATGTDTGELAQLKQENALLKEQLDNIRRELSQREQQREAALRAEASNTDMDVEDEDPLADNPDPADDDENRERRRRDRGNGWSEERAAEFRAGVDQFYSDAISTTTAPEAQERLAALQDYTNQMMDLRQQMRAEQDPAARQALEDELDALRDEMRPIMREQQDFMLREAAASSGVTDPKVQAQLIDSFRDTMRSPFFMQDRGWGRGGGGGFGGGGGGGGGSNGRNAPPASQKQ